MKRLTLLLMIVGSLSAGCASQREPAPTPESVKPKPSGAGYCPPAQAIKGLC